MSEAFDPYKKWLGISPKDRPPHHYRLLGLELFESDPDVITTAADSRMVLVGAGVLLLGLVALIAVLASRGDGKAVSEQPDAQSDLPAATTQKTGKTKQPGANQPKENGSKIPAAKTPEIKTPENKTPEVKTSEPKTGDNPPEPLPKEAPKVPSNPDPNRTLAALLDPPAVPDDAALHVAFRRCVKLGAVGGSNVKSS